MICRWYYLNAARSHKIISFPHPPLSPPSPPLPPPPAAPQAAPLNATATKETDWVAVAKEYDAKSPLQIIDHALKTFGDEVAIAFSGAEDVALIEYAHLTGRKYRVFSLDTGRLNPETYRLFDKVEKHYGIRIEYTFPEAQEVTDLVRAKGLFSFYEDGHQECCRIRKVWELKGRKYIFERRR